MNDRHPLDGNMIAADEYYEGQECPGCAGGEKWPEDESFWQCPVCENIFIDDDEIEQGDGEAE